MSPMVRRILGLKSGLSLPTSATSDEKWVAEMLVNSSASNNGTEPLATATPEIEELRQEAKKHVSRSLAPGTRRSYALALRSFVTFCREHGRNPLPADVETVLLFLTQYGRGRKPPTLIIARAAIQWVHRHRDFIPSPTDHPSVATLLEGHAREVGAAQVQKYALTSDDVRAMVKQMDMQGGAHALRDKAMTLVSFAGAFRRSEITTRRSFEDDAEVGIELCFEDITFSRHGVRIRLRKSKTDQIGEGQNVHINHGAHPETCPILALENWVAFLRQRGVFRGPVFRPLIRRGDRLVGDVSIADRAISPCLWALRIKYWAKLIGLDPSIVSGHSFRSGHVTEAVLRKADLFSIQEQGRWKNVDLVRRYYHAAQLHKNNSSSKLGL